MAEVPEELIDGRELVVTLLLDNGADDVFVDELWDVN